MVIFGSEDINQMWIKNNLSMVVNNDRANKRAAQFLRNIKISMILHFFLFIRIKFIRRIG